MLIPTPFPTLPIPVLLVEPSMPILVPEVVPEWESTGNWYRDHEYETSLNAALEAQGTDAKSRVATLDAPPELLASDLSLSVGCFTGAKVMYLTPYTFVVPPSVDTYVAGIWNTEAGEWVEVLHYRNPILTDDGSAIYVSNNAQIRGIVEVLRKADKNVDPNLKLSVAAWDSAAEGGLLSNFDPTGLDDALAYLPCY